ncbi:MAG: hypothetical protein RLZZ360_125 [Candidatus Parcubacteria bacterium]|jgi:hypothetical protein
MKYSLLAILSFLTLPAIALAGGSEGFVPLVGIPGLEGQPTFDDYIDALYALAISVAALIAVIQLIIGGAQYMMDDLITSKSAAKERIKNALIGLLIIIAAALILTTINSNLTSLTINAPVIDVDNSTPSYISEAIGLCEKAINRNATCESVRCTTAVNFAQTDQYCANMCTNVLQGVMTYNGYNRCHYASDLADQCDPQKHDWCCVNIKGGSWDSATKKCSGMTSTQTLIAQCYSGGQGTWDATNGTCLTTNCDPKTDGQCCKLGFGGTLSGGQCVTAVQNQQDCEATNGTWNAQANTCTPKDVANDQSECLARTGDYLWDATTGSCVAVSFINPPPYILDQCQGDISCIQLGCKTEGFSYFDAGPPVRCAYVP